MLSFTPDPHTVSFIIKELRHRHDLAVDVYGTTEERQRAKIVFERSVVALLEYLYKNTRE
jgi:hypothetical protein